MVLDKTQHLGERIATPVCALVRNDTKIDGIPIAITLQL